ncbi:uncharacterized protein KGF55_005642 [Candida pseudojiufengensis]|uniref:uncharacterized protein n=1 Tax=Candida pseudojiufengensis TaxID=497109 RepID=UPI002224102C|nr:uncharacterized protein KGF55_005642 [Candida pseudojiufengensis]KAI5958988.1 hypothetical protein KGF55_005642 [Candida pseudojiufengensis]
MPEYANHLRATFEPSDTKLLTSSSTSKLLIESPTLVTALSQIFPYLLLIDSFLETITWTNDDHYRNFLIMTIYSCLVIYWNLISYFILPILLSLFFANLIWSISSIIYDSKYDEKPTIDEVIYTLHNITVRFEMILRPIKHLPFTFKNFSRLIFGTILITPIHLLLIKTILPPQKYLWFVGIFIFTFNSPYSYAIRQLLWRSLYLRIAVVYVTGLDIKVSKYINSNEFTNASDLPINTNLTTTTTNDSEDQNKLPTLSNFKIINKKMISPTQLKQTVVFEILENQRRWLGIGWSTLLYPSERNNFCYNNTFQPAPNILINNQDDDFPFPIFENDIYVYQWEWIDKFWKVDNEFNKGKGRDGWVYYDNKWEHPRYKDGFSKYTRSRKWIRTAALIIDKHETVYDE